MESTKHVTQQQVDDFRGNRLTPDDTLVVGDHLAECAECRAFVPDSDSAFMRTACVISAELAVDEHISYDEMEEYAARKLSTEERERVDAHAAECSTCKAELDEFVAFQATLAQLAPEKDQAVKQLGAWERFKAALSPRQPAFRYATGFAVLAICCIFVVVKLHGFAPPTINEHPGSNGGKPTVTQPSTAPGSKPTTPPQTTPTTTPTNSRDVEEAYNDGSRNIGVDKNGAITVDGAPEHLSANGTNLGGGTVTSTDDFPGPIAMGKLLPGPTLLSPATTTLETAKPTFRWSSMGSGATYTVVIDNADGSKRLAFSPGITTTAWTPTAPLPRGQVLSWRVWAVMPNGDRACTPTTGDKLEQFRVLGASDVIKLNAARKAHAGNPLALGIALARLGQYGEAERDLSVYLHAHPGNKNVAHLMANIIRLARRSGQRV